mgnify:CR=1 FL=1
MLLLYADGVALFENTLGNTQKLMKALEIFCMHTKLALNSSTIKIMLEELDFQQNGESMLLILAVPIHPINVSHILFHSLCWKSLIIRAVWLFQSVHAIDPSPP